MVEVLLVLSLGFFAATLLAALYPSAWEKVVNVVKGALSSVGVNVG